jgi:ubiquinone/menaquinone biosynthesis C-methylase UbiE
VLPEKTKEHHIFDPKHIDVLESKERKTWQNPDEILNQLDLKASQSVADLGCGSGYFSVPISFKVKQVYAIDVQQEMLDHVKKKIHNQKISNIKTLLSQDNKIPLPDQSIDKLLTVNTLHEFNDKTTTLNEIYRVLKPDGQVIIVDFKKSNTNFGPPESVRISKEHATKLFENHNFDIVKTHDLLHHYLIVLKRK